METKRIVIKDRKNIKDEELAEAAAAIAAAIACQGRTFGTNGPRKEQIT